MINDWKPCNNVLGKKKKKKEEEKIVSDVV